MSCDIVMYIASRMPFRILSSFAPSPKFSWSGAVLVTIH